MTNSWNFVIIHALAVTFALKTIPLLSVINQLTNWTEKQHICSSWLMLSIFVLNLFPVNQTVAKKCQKWDKTISKLCVEMGLKPSP